MATAASAMSAALRAPSSSHGTGGAKPALCTPDLEPCTHKPN